MSKSLKSVSAKIANLTLEVIILDQMCGCLICDSIDELFNQNFAVHCKWFDAQRVNFQQISYTYQKKLEKKTNLNDVWG